MTGTIPSSIGDLIHLKELRLSRNQLVGTIPSSIGGLVDLKHLHVDGNRQLTGALPPIVSKECSINTNDTNISRVEIKTKPLRQWYDYGFVVTHVFLGYIDHNCYSCIEYRCPNHDSKYLVYCFECIIGSMDVEG